MCLYMDEKLTKKYRARRTKVKVWKVVHENGRAIFRRSYQYKPGINLPRRPRKTRKGIEIMGGVLHVHLRRKGAVAYGGWGRCILPLTVPPRSILAVGADGVGVLTAALTKLTIPLATWKRAGLPLPKKGR